MALEDHTGDIIQKARQAGRIPLGAAAQAAGLSETEFAALESAGLSPRPVSFQALANLLGLSGPKLEAIARGWLPERVDLSGWRELRPISTTQGGNAVNCYLVWDEATREAALFDTGWEAGPVFALVDDNELALKHLYLTHSHEDHVAALGELRGRFPLLRLHSSSSNAPPEQRNRPQDCLSLGSLRITFRDTPGHSEDGATYIVGGFPGDAPLVAIVGDALFAGSLGRGFQSSTILKQKVRGQILSLPPSTLLCPGHGPLTTVAEELAHNPFF